MKTFIEQASTITGEVVDALLPGMCESLPPPSPCGRPGALFVLTFCRIASVKSPKHSLDYYIRLPAGQEALYSSPQGGLVQDLYAVAESTVGGVSSLI